MSFIEELKKRKVFRVAASYAVVAFIIFQLVEILFPIFNFPQWTQQFIVIIILLGFPIAVIFSWIFDKTPEGFIKTTKKNIKTDPIKKDDRPFYLQKRNLLLIFGLIGGVLIGSFGKDLLPKEDYDEIHNTIVKRVLSTTDVKKWNTIPRTYKEIDDLRVKFEKNKETKKLKMLEDINVYVEELEKNPYL